MMKRLFAGLLTLVLVLSLVPQRIRFRDMCQLLRLHAEKRTAGAGQYQPFNLPGIPHAHEALKNGRML